MMNFIDNENHLIVSKLWLGYENCIYFLINLVTKPQLCLATKLLFGNVKYFFPNEGIVNENQFLDLL